MSEPLHVHFEDLAVGEVIPLGACMVDEAALLKEIEHMETVLGTLDGQFSLKNATVMVDVT